MGSSERNWKRERTENFHIGIKLRKLLICSTSETKERIGSQSRSGVIYKKGNEFESCGDGTQALRAMGSFIKGKENGGKKPVGKDKKPICRVGSRNGRAGHTSDDCDWRGGYSGSCRLGGQADG